MTKIVVYPNAKGVISNAGKILGQSLQDGAVVIEYDGDMTLPPSTAAVLRDGAVEIVPNWIGSGPWYDQDADLASRETAIHIEEVGIDPTTKNWAMQPRPLTKAEKAALDKAEAEAKAKAEAEAKAAADAAERERIAGLEVTDYQLALALVGAGVISQQDAEAYVSVGTLPAAFEAGLAAMPEAARAAARIKIMGAKTIKRSDPIIIALAEARGSTPEDVDGLFVAAAAL